MLSSSSPLLPPRPVSRRRKPPPPAEFAKFQASRFLLRLAGGAADFSSSRASRLVWLQPFYLLPSTGLIQRRRCLIFKSCNTATQIQV